MKFRLFIGSFSAAVLAVIVFMSSSTAFAQTPTDDDGASITPSASEKLTAVRVDNPGTFSASTKYSRETAITKEVSADPVDAPTNNAAQSGSDPKWQFAFAPYLYLAGLSGTVGARGRTATIDQSIGDVLSKFKAGFMGSFEARRGKLVLVNDLMWIKLTEERSTPGGLYDTGKVSVNMTIFNPQGGIRVAEGKGGSFDILGGLRVTSVKNILSFTPGTLPGFSAEERKTWAAPTIGGHGVANLSSKVFLSTIFDVGGGFGTHFTGQFYGGAGYKIKPKIALIGGYRYLKNDYSDDTGFIFNTGMNGLVLGAKFGF